MVSVPVRMFYFWDVFIFMLYSLGAFLIKELSHPHLLDIMYLLTEWEGRKGKYLAQGQDVRFSLCSVRTSWPWAKYFPVRPDLAQSISILSYDLKILKILFEPKKDAIT